MIDNKYNSYKRYINNVLDSSRWAEPAEIKNSSTVINLNAKKCSTSGIPLISDANKAWVDGADNHTLIFGSTGSKKTRLFVMPTINMMIKAGESFIATDPKGELFERTSGLAKENGYDIKVLNFRNIGFGECWNPLYYPYTLYKKGEVDKASSLLNDFVMSVTERQESKGHQDPFWIDSSRAFCLGCLLLLMEAGEPEEINVMSLVKMCDYSLEETFNKLVNKMDPTSVCAANLNAILTAADKTLRSIMISLFSNLSIFVTQSNLSAMLSNNTVDVKNIGRKKTAFYIIVPDEKTATHFLVTAFVKQAYEMLIEQAQTEKNGQLKVRVNFMLDEFCNVPRIPDMPNMISAARSRNIRYFLIVQSAHQLESRYDVDADTIKGNCLNWVFLSSKELELLNEIRDLCGNSDYEGTPLISSSQLQRLNKQKGEVLILHDRCYPFISELPDIDEYECFKGYPAVKLGKLTLSQPKALDLRLLEMRCRMLTKPYPFSTSVTTAYADFNSDDLKLTNMLIGMILHRKIKQETALLNELKRLAEENKWDINFDNI